ncbi:MAG: glycosyl hydrolase [Deltaproteobacteria bacterium]|nr:glycosyl hydrolase [Deltaproteobacteria bacterium]
MRKRTLSVLALVLMVGGCRSLTPITRPDALADPGPDTSPADAVETADLPVETDTPDPGMDPGLPKDPGPDAADGETGQPTDVADTLVDPGADTPGQAIPRPCEVVFTWTGGPDTLSVTVPGEWNAWEPTSHPLSASGAAWTVTVPASEIGAGEWGYKFLVNGTDWSLDPANPLVKYVGDDHTMNSRVTVPDCNLPLLELESVEADWAAKSVEVVVRAYTGIGGEDLTHASLSVEAGGVPLVGDWFDPATQRFVVKRTGLEPGKHSLVFNASSSQGDARPLFVPVWLEKEPFNWEDAVLYFAMTDRFKDGDPTNSAPASCLQAGHKANWLGGDFEGIRQKIESGYFDSLGVTALWVSPANDNPNGCYGGDLSLSYTAYHGYFPLSLDQSEDHFGDLDDLRNLVDAAHARGIRVLMDLVANHVHIDSDLWSLHKDWFHQDVIVCGDDNNWNDHPIDCWFQPYMPDLDYRKVDATVAFTDAAIRWAREADLDGFRVDAVKHMIHDFGRTLKVRVKADLEASGVPFYLVGETFVSEWGDGAGDAENTIKAYVSKDELDGQFDFPLYWEILKVFARGEGGMDRLAQVTAGSAGFYGTDAIMSTFLGNHDVPRFMSHATGDIPDQWGNGSKEIGWNNPPVLPTDPEPFQRLEQAFAFLMALPGVPLIYYGDEVGLPGAGDPDNRRMMTFDGLSDHQLTLRQAVGALAQVRAAHPATRRGDFQVLWSDPDGLAFAVSTPGDAVVAVFNRAEGRTIAFDLAGVPGLVQAGPLSDALTGNAIDVVAGQVDLFVDRYHYRLLVAQVP